jgi:hypothetical protein
VQHEPAQHFIYKIQKKIDLEADIGTGFVSAFIQQKNPQS